MGEDGVLHQQRRPQQQVGEVQLVGLGELQVVELEDRAAVFLQKGEKFGVKPALGGGADPFQRLLPGGKGQGGPPKRVAGARQQQAVLAELQKLLEDPGGPLLNLPAGGLEHHLPDRLQAAGLVADGEVGADVGEGGGGLAQQPPAEAVDGADLHLGGRLPGQGGNPLAHLLAGPVGEGEAEDLLRLGGPAGEQPRHPRGQGEGLAGARPGQHQQIVFPVLRRQPLLGVELQVHGEPSSL